MSAEPAPTPSNKKRDIIVKFRDEYGLALADAQVSAEHTDTEGWQKLYTGWRTQRLKTRQQLAQRLQSLADTMEAHGLDEDDEKALNDIKKESMDLRERCAIFERETIGPVIQPVRECERIAEQYRGQAQRDETNAPLVNAGLEVLMRDAIAAVHRPTWDADSGRITILDAKQERDAA